MINLTCDACGTSLEVVGSVERHGEAYVVVACSECNETIEGLTSDLENARSESDSWEEEYNLLIADVEIERERSDNEIKDLKDFIDGYIDDR